MPQLMHGHAEPTDLKVKTYPVPCKTVSGAVNGVATIVTTNSFTDKIVVTISQEGRLAQWVPLSSRDPQTLTEPMASMMSGPTGDGDDEDGLLPLSHLTARTLLGASNEERETTGQLYATQIASSLLAKRPEESRTLLVGLGLKPVVQASREQFFELLELVLQTL